MAVRNFYVRGDIDGRQTELTGGPTNKNGGMKLYVTQRDNGNVVRAFSIESREYNGKLTTRVFGPDYEMIGELITDR